MGSNNVLQSYDHAEIITDGLGRRWATERSQLESDDPQIKFLNVIRAITDETLHILFHYGEIRGDLNPEYRAGGDAPQWVFKPLTHELGLYGLLCRMVALQMAESFVWERINIPVKPDYWRSNPAEIASIGKQFTFDMQVGGWDQEKADEALSSRKVTDSDIDMSLEVEFIRD